MRLNSAIFVDSSVTLPPLGRPVPGGRFFPARMPNGQNVLVQTLPLRDAQDASERAARDQFEIDGSLRTLLRDAPWITMDAQCEELCTINDHCHDALVASLVARASALELCEPIPEDALDEARREGWIALPVAASLSLLNQS